MSTEYFIALDTHVTFCEILNELSGNLPAGESAAIVRIHRPSHSPLDSVDSILNSGLPLDLHDRSERFR